MDELKPGTRVRLSAEGQGVFPQIQDRDRIGTILHYTPRLSFNWDCVHVQWDGKSSVLLHRDFLEPA